MWKFAKRTTFTAATAALAYGVWSNLQPQPQFPLLTPKVSDQSYLLAKEKLDGKVLQSITNSGLPIYSLAANTSQNLGLKLGDQSLYFISEINGQKHISPLDHTQKVQQWLHLNTNPIQKVNSRLQLENLMKNRKKFDFLDSFVLCYIPEQGSNLPIFQQLIKLTQSQDALNSSLLSNGKTHLHFLQVTDLELASQLGLIGDDLVFMRMKDSRGWFHAKHPRSAYADPSILKEYFTSKLSENYRLNGHEMQLELQLYCDKFYLSSETDLLQNKFSDLRHLAQHLTVVDPLICPLWKLKDLQMILSKLLYFISTHQQAKIMLVSVNQDKTQRNTQSIQQIFNQMNLEQFARAHKDVLVVVGYPQLIYHLPLKDCQIYHFEPVQIRLLTVEQNETISSKCLQEGMTLEDLLQTTDEYQQSSPLRSNEYSELLSTDDIFEKIVKRTEEPMFVMYCSKHCPACSYQNLFFQQAARQSTDCKFYKYLVSNQSPYFKGPNATPTYCLYLPGEKEPIIYSPKINGIQPSNFLEFIAKAILNHNLNGEQTQENERQEKYSKQSISLSSRNFITKRKLYYFLQQQIQIQQKNLK